MSDGTHTTFPAGGGAGRKRAAAYFSAGILIAATVAAIAAVVAGGGGGDSDEPAAGAAFQPDYVNLVARREGAGVSTMGDPQDASAHFHPRLAIYANGERIPIPVNIGIDPAQSGEAMASLHTHETDGTIHVEGMSQATLGQLFQIWGLPLSSEELGPYRADAEKTLRMWVDGEPSTAFENLGLEDGQEVVVSFGPKDAPPPPLEVGG
jgi:hypothetical protein